MRIKIVFLRNNKRKRVSEDYLKMISPSTVLCSGSGHKMGLERPVSNVAQDESSPARVFYTCFTMNPEMISICCAHNILQFLSFTEIYKPKNDFLL